VAIVAAADADTVVSAMRSHDVGRDAVRIGDVVAEHPGLVAARTLLGSTRVVDTQVGEQLPRIC
jgi:hydrogenase expression/formation protein HypE